MNAGLALPEAPVAPDTIVPVAPVAVASAAVTTPSSIAYTYKRFPLTIVRGEGVTLFDDTGKAYLDCMSGIATNAFGYNDAGVNAAIAEAMSTGLIHLSNLVTNEPAEKLAHFLTSRTFADKVFFCNSGVEAVEGAFKFARRWGRSISPDGAKHEIVAVRGSFHGRLFASVAATDRAAYRMPFRPLTPGIFIAERDLDALSTVLSPETTAALIIEPVQGEGGVRPMDHGFLRELRALTREREVLLILDEIQCGMGRTGCFLAHEPVGIKPDIVTLAKPLAGGLPIGAVLLTKEVASTLQPGEHGTTFGGGPLVTHVAQHVCERLADPAMLQRIREDGAWFGAQLAALKDTHASVRAVRGVGYMWGVDVTEPASAVIERARAHGLLIISAGDHTLRILPPLVATREDLGRAVAMLDAALREGAAAA
ncbi:MAG TPA: acetylornithine transaminase [Gemmatimonadaceae bacterium]|nr:acetylornithine transaminase [Gemmatimonadaceae bacterium]